MRELTTTRNNPMIDPSLHIWGGEIAIYLFLGGLVAGIMMISGYFLLRGRHKEVECSCLRMPALSILFLVSGLSTAAALVHLLARDRCERELLARADIGFLAAELTIILLFLIGLLSSTRVHIEAALLLISGPYAPVFWVFVIGLGIVIPLLIQPLAVSHRIAHTPVAPVLVIAGGLILRYVIVFAGQASHWDPLAVSR